TSTTSPPWSEPTIDPNSAGVVATRFGVKPGAPVSGQVGSPVLYDAIGGVTGAVVSELVVDEPAVFVAVTTTPIDNPTSAVVGVYVDPVAPAIGAQLPPAHRCQCPVYAIGAAPAQVPFDEVSVDPTRGVPVTFGSPVLNGEPDVLVERRF